MKGLRSLPFVRSQKTWSMSFLPPGTFQSRFPLSKPCLGRFSEPECQDPDFLKRVCSLERFLRVRDAAADEAAGAVTPSAVCVSESVGSLRSASLIFVGPCPSLWP